MLVGGRFVAGIISAQQERGFQAGFMAAGKALPDEKSFPFRNLVAEERRGEEREWVVHRAKVRISGGRERRGKKTRLRGSFTGAGRRRGPPAPGQSGGGSSRSTGKGG